jgi:hypothetical protein
MGIPNWQFEGISTNIPGVYTKSEYPPSLGAIGPATNVVAVIGKAKGGIPHNASGVDDDNKVNVLTSVAQAIDLLRGGNGMYMTEFYLSPTKDPNLGAPSQCLFFRVDPALKGTGTMQDGSLNDIIDLESTRYGALANQISRKVEAGTNIGHKCTVKFQGNIVGERDDIGFEYLQIQYTGAAATCTMNITDTQLDTSAAATPADDLTILFEEFKTLIDLVEYISAQPNYTCVMLGKSNADTTTFDAVTAQDIKSSAYTAEALVEAMIQFLTNETGGELKASLHASAVRTDVVNDSNYVFLANGTDGTASNTHWTATLALMEMFPINHILVASGDQAINAMVSQHCQDMSKIEEKRNRSASGGGLAATALDARILEAKALNDARFEYWMTPFKRPDVLNNNVATAFDPFLFAALSAGIRYANHETISSVFKTVNALAVTESYDTPTKKKIINAGGSLAGKEERGIVIIHNVTTYQGENLILNLPSMLRTSDAITLDSQAKILVRLANQLRAPNALIIRDMQNYLISNLLPNYRDIDGWLTDDPISGEKAFSDVEFSLSGDRFDFKFTGIIPAPLHGVFIKQKFLVVGYNR